MPPARVPLSTRMPDLIDSGGRRNRLLAADERLVKSRKKPLICVATSFQSQVTRQLLRLANPAVSGPVLSRHAGSRRCPYDSFPAPTMVALPVAVRPINLLPDQRK